MHRIQTRVYWEDTDAGGIVYHANYLKFLERARSEWLLALGIDQTQLARLGLLFVVKSMAIEYRQPAQLMDQLEVTVKLSKVRRASLELSQQVLRQGQCLFEAEVVVAVLDRQQQKPVALPAELLTQLHAQVNT